MKQKKESVNLEKTQYNKAQLEYLKQRITDAKSGALERWEDLNPEPKDLTDEEKYRQIAAGEAKLKAFKDLDSYNPMRTDLEDSFDFREGMEKTEWNAERKKIAQRLTKLENKAHELIYFGNQRDLTAFLENMEDLYLS